MADKEISALTAASALGGTEVFHVKQGANSRKATIDQAKTYITKFSGARVYASGATSLTSSAVSIAFASESYDTDSYHDNVTNNTRLTIPSNGIYRITGQIKLATSSADTYEFARIRLNGTTDIARHALVHASTTPNNSGSWQVTAIANLTASDYVTLDASCSPNDNTATGEYETWFAIERLGNL